MPASGKRCTIARPCGLDLVCLGARCSPITIEPPPKACDDNSDCTNPKRSLCDAEDGICVQCRDDTHCAYGEVCGPSNRCFPCKTDADCGTNLCIDFHCAACDTGAGLACSDGLTCEDGVCKDPLSSAARTATGNTNEGTEGA